MLYFIGTMLLLVFLLIGGPFWLFPTQMQGFGSYLTGVAAIIAALKFSAPYLVVLFYKKRYSNEIIWKSFLGISESDENGRVLETDWIAGTINYFRRCKQTLHMDNPWYNKLPYFSDDVFAEFETTNMVGKKESNLFAEVKELLYKAGHIVAMNSTPDRPFVKEEKYDELVRVFCQLVEKSEQMNKLVVAVPLPVKKIIEGDDMFKSYFKTPKNLL